MSWVIQSYLTHDFRRRELLEGIPVPEVTHDGPIITNGSTGPTSKRS